MKIYIGNAGTRAHIELMKKNGWGRMHIAKEWRYPEESLSWALDNGAYSAWVNGLPFDEGGFMKALDKIKLSCSEPDFIIVPDIVAGGNDSLLFSLSWLAKIPCHYKRYLAVQDGMEPSEIKKSIHYFDGLFVGGTLDWKIKTALGWVRLSHREGKKCHIGKVGTFKRLVWARSLGADSIDSSTFVQAKPGTGFQRIQAANQQTHLEPPRVEVSR